MIQQTCVFFGAQVLIHTGNRGISQLVADKINMEPENPPPGKGKLVGGFNPSEKYYSSQIGSFPQIGVKIKNV